MLITKPGDVSFTEDAIADPERRGSDGRYQAAVVGERRLKGVRIALRHLDVGVTEELLDLFYPRHPLREAADVLVENPVTYSSSRSTLATRMSASFKLAM